MKVTAEDTTTTTETYTVVVTQEVATEVPADWSLTPAGLASGDQFRLVFLSSTKRDGSSSDIADYNTFIQDLAADGHADIRAYSSGFRVVGCTEAVDARDNTGSNYTNSDKGVPIYWLGGAKAADDYEDFYDGSWDDEANDKDESGADGPNTSLLDNYPITGCDHDGTEAFFSNSSRALGSAYSVSVGLPNISSFAFGPISSMHISTKTNTRPMYGLSEVFQVPPSTDATLSNLALQDQYGTAVSLNPTFAPGTLSYTASVPSFIDEITIIPTVNDGNATYEIQDRRGRVLVDADSIQDDFQVSLQARGRNIRVEVTSEDTTTTGTYRVVVTRAMATEVPVDWSLIPAGLGVGDQFRLLFLSSTKRDGSSSDIGDYNTFIQNRAAAGHADIRTYSSNFRVVGCTEAVDARDNTGSTYTNSDKGVPIYWLGGVKAADDYEDFYDGSWDNEANDKDESGANGPNTSLVSNYPLTGCDHDGTEAFTSDDVSRALGNGNIVRVARPNDSRSGNGPLSSTLAFPETDTLLMYGLSDVFQVARPTDATLSNLALRDQYGTAVSLNPTFAPGTLSYTASVPSFIDEITIIPTVNDGNATYETQDGSGTALVDADSTQDDFQVSLAEGENTIRVEVTAEDTSTTQTYTVRVTREVATEVPANWSLIPAGLVIGDQFRLLFLSSTKRDGSSSDIADYNTFIQNRAAAGHADIRTYSSNFRVVGCTEAVDARDNTGSTYTSSDKGVPIYWLGGAKAADDYEDFYDGSWDNEANDKDESGANGPNTSQFTNYPFTGCDHDGTEAFTSDDMSRALGSSGNVRVGRPNESIDDNGPIGSLVATASSNTRPMYALSEVFEVGPFDATLSNLELKEGSTQISLAPAFAPETLSYTARVMTSVDEITIIPTGTDSNSTFEYQDGSGTVLVDADSIQDGFQVSLAVGENTIRVKVTARDLATTETYTVVVTRLAMARVTIAPSTSTAVEGNPVVFLMRRSEDNGAVTVRVEVSQNGDFLSGSTSFGASAATTPVEVSVDFPPGVITRTLSLDTENDYLDEADGSVTLTVQADPAGLGYTVGTPHVATASVVDDDVAPELYIFRSPSPPGYTFLVDEMVEGKAIRYIFARSHDAGPQTLDVAISQQGAFLAANHPDGLTVPAGGRIQVGFPAETLTTSIILNTEDDRVPEADGSVTLTVLPRPSDTLYPVAAQPTTTMTIRDNDHLPTVTIVANISSLTEGSSIPFTLTRTSAPGSTTVRCLCRLS